MRRQAQVVYGICAIGYLTLCVALAVVMPSTVIVIAALGVGSVNAAIMWRCYQGAAAGIRGNTSPDIDGI